jgi:ABC-type Zn uptake system ZnuABC Zn-binding protein ZnuA
MAEHLPEHREGIVARTGDVIASLRELDETCRQRLRDVPRRQLVTFHNAFDRFARRYGLEVVGHLTPIELAPGGEVTSRRLTDAIALIREHDLPVVYSEPQFPQSRVAPLVEAAGVEVLVLDPLGHPDRAGYETYQAMVRSNLATLVKGQSMSTGSGGQ